MTTLSVILTPERFRQWLEAQEPGSHVGYSDSPTQCPLARYVSMQFSGNEVRVCRDIKVWPHPAALLPDWAYTFASYLDAAIDGLSGQVGMPVTREDALRLLGEVLADGR